MKLKKLNAILALLSILLLLAHLGYSVYAYLTFYYNPTATRLLAGAACCAVCIHAVLGMCLVFLMGDGTRLAGYARPNLGTVLQRVSAALLLPLLLPHVQNFSLLQGAAQEGRMFKFTLVMVLEILFFADVILHIAVSLSRAFITLGWLQKPETRRRLDRAVWVLGALIFLVASFAVARTQLAMFLH